MKRTATSYVAINPRHCMACWKCVGNCPVKAIGKAGFLLHRHVVFKNADACIGCGKCIKTCPNSVFFKPGKTIPGFRAEGHASLFIERMLPLAFVASAVSGVGLHIAGHGMDHELWHNWAVAHVLTNLLWLVSVWFHVKRHVAWFKSIVNKGIGGKSLLTFVLSVIFLIVAVTGIVLLVFVDGASSAIGSWHYRLGIILLAFSFVHAVVKR